MKKHNIDFFKIIFFSFTSVLVRRLLNGIFDSFELVPDVTLILLCFSVLKNRHFFYRTQFFSVFLGLFEDLLSITPLGFWGIIRLTESSLLIVTSNFLETSYMSFYIGFFIFYILEDVLLYTMGNYLGIIGNLNIFYLILSLFLCFILIPFIRYLFKRFRLLSDLEFI